MVLQLIFNLLQVIRAIDLNDPVDLGSIPHKLFRTRVQHLDFGVARYWKVV